MPGSVRASTVSHKTPDAPTQSVPATTALVYKASSLEVPLHLVSSHLPPAVPQTSVLSILLVSWVSAKTDLFLITRTDATTLQHAVISLW